ncbi:glutathionylspermidine synthase [Salmonella enterica subsp. enterica serovar Thompson]|nr:glutathionylspermidine synthase [Salmonella enterica subsp. enterica serovar Thompson]
MSKGTTSQDAPFGTLLGYAPGGVAIYSSDYNSLDPWDDDDAAFRSYIDDEYMGINGSAWNLPAVFSF